MQFVNETEDIVSATTRWNGIPDSEDSEDDCGGPPSQKQAKVDVGKVHGSSQSACPRAGKKTLGRVKIKMEYIKNKVRRYTTFSKRKTGMMKKVLSHSLLKF